MARPRPPAIPFRTAIADGFPVSVFRRETRSRVHAPTMHSHRFFVLLYADRGRGTLTLPRRHVTIRPGDVHLIPPGELHDTGRLGDVGGWVVEFTADVLHDAGRTWSSGLFGAGCGQPLWFGFLCRRLDTARLTVPPSLRAQTDARLADLERELRERRFAWQDAARSALSMLLIDLLRLSAPDGLPPRLAPLVEEVFAVVDARYAERISLREVARAVGRSPSHVTSVVRQQTGLTVLEWITERRLDEARRRLRDSDEDVAIIADRVGFGSVNHFLRQFRRAHGLSPGAWRRTPGEDRPVGAP